MGFFDFLIDLMVIKAIAYRKGDQVLDEGVKSHHYWLPAFDLLCFCRFFDGSGFH